MRFQDELLGGFATLTDVEARRYLLRQIGDLSQTFDFERVIGALRAEEDRADAPLAPLATSILTRLLPPHLAATMGIDPSRSLLASGLTDPRARPARRSKDGQKAVPTWVPCLPPALRALQNEVWLAAGSHLLEACLGPLLTRARDRADPRRSVALRGLTRMMHHQSRRFLLDTAASDPQAAVALAQTADPEALQPVLDLIGRPDMPRADLVRALVLYPAKDVVTHVKTALSDPSLDVRVAGAMALEGLTDVDPFLVARDLLATKGDRWPLVHAVDSLGRVGSPGQVEAIAQVFRSTDDIVVQIAAVRSIVNLGGEAAAPFCLKVLQTGSDGVKAVVLGGLARLGVRLTDLRDTLVSLVDAPHPRLALNAAILLARIDPAVSARRAVSWLRSTDPKERLSGAFLLGYLPSDASTTIATKLAMRDPCAEVRAELLRCLSKLPAEQAGPALEGCLAQEDPALGARAIRLYARATTEQHSELARRLSRMLGAQTDPAIRTEIVTQLGLTGELSTRAVLAPEIRSEVQAVACAAARAIGVLGDGLQPDELRRLDDRTPPQLQAQAACSLWALGDPDAPARIARLLAGDERAFDAGARALEEICLVLPRMTTSRRFVSLQERMSQHIMSPAYAAFAAERLGIRPLAHSPAARGYTDMNMGEEPSRSAMAPETYAHILGELDVSAMVLPAHPRAPDESTAGSRAPGSPRATDADPAVTPVRRPAAIPPAPATSGWSARTAGIVLGTALAGIVLAALLRSGRAPTPPHPHARRHQVVGAQARH